MSLSRIYGATYLLHYTRLSNSDATFVASVTMVIELLDALRPLMALAITLCTALCSHKPQYNLQYYTVFVYGRPM